MKKILLIILMLVLVGWGCSSKKTVTTTPTITASSTETEVKKKPVEFDPNLAIYEFCKSKGFEIIIRFDKASQSPKAFCRFPGSRECIASEFMNGTCTPEKGAKLYVPENQITTNNCTTTDPVVCGTDNRTYINHCSADLANIPISHTGSCSDTSTLNQIITKPEDSYRESKAVTTSKTTLTETNKTTTPTNTPIPDWIKNITDIIKSEPASRPTAYIARCSINGTVYYQSDGCASCFSVLYKDNGTVICYPSNDFSGSCPAGFNKDKVSQECDIIWKDKR